MNCPHCQQPLPESHTNAICCYCQRELTPGPLSAGDAPTVGRRWAWFFILLVAPPILSLLSAFVHEAISPWIAIVSSVLSALAGGILLGSQIGKTRYARIGFVVLFTPLMFVVCLVLSMFGCTLGGGGLDMH
jgi:hypothetical protein